MKTGIVIKLAAERAGFGQQFQREVLRKNGGSNQGSLDRLASQIKTEGDRTRKIRVVNTTNDKEIAFAFKSFGYKQYRVDRTVEALKAYLMADGLSADQAFDVVNKAVSRNYQNRYEPLSGATILHIKSLRDTVLAEKLGSASATGIQVSSTVEGVSGFLTQQGFRVGKTLGSGSFGVVKHLTGRDNSALVVKFFVDPKNQKSIKKNELSFVRSPGMKVNEGIASYLAKSSKPDWKKTEAMAIPTHYVVTSKDQTGRDQMEVISVSDIKARTRAAGGGGLQCVAQIMEKLPGEDVFDAMGAKGEALASFQSRLPALARSGLETLMQINERGVLHRDIKPENMRCHGESLYFFDWGMAYKMHKPVARDDVSAVSDPVLNAQATHDLPTGFMGTMGYIHPDMFKKNPVGSQGDLFAFGMSLLEMSSPVMRNILVAPMRKGGELYRPDKIPDAASLGLIISRSRVGTASERTALLQSLANPNSTVNLALKCLELSDTGKPSNSAQQWANRDYSRAKYAELLNHPAISMSRSLIAKE